MQLSPKQIVVELDKYIIGQEEAKHSVAIALRNRYRRSKLDSKMQEEVTPKNIIMKGPTGVGKTEIARRLAKLVKAPFVKVEATKYTEVGYVGRDVESMIRDLVEEAIRLVKSERYEGVKPQAMQAVEERLKQYLFVDMRKTDSTRNDTELRAYIAENLANGNFDNKEVEVEIVEAPQQMQMMQGMGVEINIGEILGGMLPKRSKRKKFTIIDARKMLLNEECDRLIDLDSVNTEALRRAEQEGIIFIDEIDKIAAKGSSNNADVSREGVQRDILPIVEGSTVNTKYGPIKTDFILFIAAGAFHISRIEDLIPELQGRFPVVVELNSLTEQDFEKILSTTENSLINQYTSLLAVDNITLKFKPDAISEIAKITALENDTRENIGARRLHTIMETLLDDISFNACSDLPPVEVVIDKNYVQKHLEKLLKEYDLKKYIL